MNAILKFVTSSIGRKYLMAISGCLLVLFVIVHMIGNWKLFFGQDDINHYAYMLKFYPLVIWGFRAGLLALAFIHVSTAASLVYDNIKARPVNYANKRNYKANLASLGMAVSGGWVLVFIVYHILHFTVQAFHPIYKTAAYEIPIPAESGIFQTLAPVHEGELYHNVYAMMIHSFSNPWITGFYIVSMAFLCMHLWHGIESSFQSLGLNARGTKCVYCLLSVGVSLLIFVGMSAVPAAVLFKLVK